ncbi:hypothetical protein J31TS4_43100 [Paenibacillus sp. J31TS4]|uniref:DUF4340 domain-containing protein n=1 Tax=Paenibacillus sp. J31TS4 TaxID=2807195 RepID=UPI001B2AC965|nr:DUF4340 domain-containing protein [Paenibacillus sp. J31TS4]GIP41030.1 hypothetical protein J31TS4_43100 [Paenibacillus sp. J31TS4]
MKKFLPTILLVLVCLGGYWYASSQNFFQEKQDDAAKPLVQAQASDLQQVKIESACGTVELVKQGEAWQMTQPQPYPVNKYMVDSWLGAFSMLSYDTKVDEQPKDLAEFGLDKPMLQLEAKLADGTSKKVLVGNALPVAGSYYAKLDGDPAVYSISETALQSLGKQAVDFAEKNAVSVDYNKVKRLDVSWKGTAWSLTKKDAAKAAYESAWTLGEKELKAENGTIPLDKLTTLSSEELPKAAAQVKLDNPELKVEVKEGGADGAETASVYVGKVEGSVVWVAKQGGAWAYPVPMDAVQALADAKADAEAAEAAAAASPSPSPAAGAPSPSASPVP